MQDFFSYMLAGITGGTVGGTGIGAFVLYLFKRHLARRDALEQQLEAEKQRRFDQLEKDFKAHVAVDNPAAVGVKLEGLTGTMEKVGDKIDRLAEDVAGLKMSQSRDREFIQNTYQGVQRLREEVHNGRK